MIKKERNLLKAYDHAEQFKGAYDMSTRTYIGVKGTYIKTVPKYFSNLSWNDYYRVMITMHRDLPTLCAHNDANLEEIESRFECLLSLHIRLDDVYVLLQPLHKLNKPFVDWLNTHCDGCYTQHNVEMYELIHNTPGLADLTPEAYDLALALISRMGRTTGKEYCIQFARRWCLEHLDFSFGRNRSIEWAHEIYHRQKAMYGECTVTPNLATNYYNLAYLYSQWQEEHYDDILRMNNDKPYLHYEDDNYIVIPLTSRAMFHAEGTAQDNCVERLYMRMVANGETNVVAIRKKSDPDKSYITCEVRNGQIYQYLYSHNRRVTDTKALGFQYAYQQHLNSLLSQN